MADLQHNNEWRGTSGPFTALLDMTPGANLGPLLLKETNDTIFGRVGLQPGAAAVLTAMLFAAGDGHHVEIGSFFGGSSVISARVKQHYNLQGMIYCVDNFSFQKGEYEVSPATIYTNAEKAGVREYIEVFKGQSYPLPLPGDVQVVSATVDAAHGAEAAYRDFQSCVARGARFIFFHDMDQEHEGVVEAVYQAIRQDNWNPLHIGDFSAVLVKP